MRKLDPRWAGPLLIGILLLAVAVQASRVPMRWSPVAIAYGAYVAEWRQAVSTEGGWWWRFVGLHPPLYAWRMAVGLKLGIPPAGWLAASGVASVSSVATVAAAVFVGLGKRGRVAALLVAALVAVSPHRVAYGLEVNNYPLLVGVLGAQMWAFALWARRGWRAPLVAMSVLLPWAHLLGATALLGQLAAVAVVERGRLRELAGLYLGVGVLMLPLGLGLGDALGEPINQQAGLGAAVHGMVAVLPGRYGLAAAGWTTAALAAWGAWSLRRDLVPLSWACCAGVGVLAVLGAQSSAQASALQTPYWLLVVLPTLALAGAVIVGREAHQGVVLALGCVVLANGLGLGLDWADARWQRGRVEATHPAVVGAIEGWQDGDVLLLAALTGSGDDDKDAVDPVWGRIPMGVALDWVDPDVPGLTGTDPHWGQPVRLSDGRWLYTFAAVDVERWRRVAATHRGRGERVVVAAYGLERDPPVARSLRGWAEEVGATARGNADEVAFAIE